MEVECLSRVTICQQKNSERWFRVAVSIRGRGLRVEDQGPANIALARSILALDARLSTLDSQWARLELNQHALAGTRPSTLRVCQFRHEPEQPSLPTRRQPFKEDLVAGMLRMP